MRIPTHFISSSGVGTGIASFDLRSFLIQILLRRGFVCEIKLSLTVIQRREVKIFHADCGYQLVLTLLQQTESASYERNVY